MCCIFKKISYIHYALTLAISSRICMLLGNRHRSSAKNSKPPAEKEQHTVIRKIKQKLA